MLVWLGFGGEYFLYKQATAFNDLLQNKKI